MNCIHIFGIVIKRSLKIFVLYLAGLFLFMHNFVPHNHIETSITKSTHQHHHNDHHDHDGDDETSKNNPLKLPSHQESVAKYIVKHNTEQSHFAPELLYYTPGVYSLDQTDPITLSYVPSTRNYSFRWDYLYIPSSYLRGPPSLFLS